MEKNEYNIDIVDVPKGIDEIELISMAKDVLQHLKQNPVSLSLAFIDDEVMAELNSDFRGEDSTTDVLSFPLNSELPEGGFYLGDIAISYEVAERQAVEYNIDYQTEVFQLFAHGLLHLSGLDHSDDDGEMNKIEMDLRAKIVDRYCRKSD